MKIFISWSGNISKEIAEILKDEIDSIFQHREGLEVFVSSKDIPTGAEWFGEICNAIDESISGILCLTEENTTNENVADWIEFEAGALAFHLQRTNKNIIPFLFEVNIPNKSPLKQFEYIKFSKNQYEKLIMDLNKRIFKKPINHKQLSDLIMVSYEKRLEPRIKKILKAFEHTEKISIFPPGELAIVHKSVYLSCPMASVRDEEYASIREFTLKIKKSLQEYCNVNDVYAPAESKKSREDFDGQEKAATENFIKLKHAEILICVFPKPVSTSLLLEVGYALALTKKIIIFTLRRYKNKLPYILQDGEKSFKNLKIYEYNNEKDIISKIKKNGESFLR